MHLLLCRDALTDYIIGLTQFWESYLTTTSVWHRKPICCCNTTCGKKKDYISWNSNSYHHCSNISSSIYVNINIYIHIHDATVFYLSTTSLNSKELVWLQVKSNSVFPLLCMSSLGPWSWKKKFMKGPLILYFVT